MTKTEVIQTLTTCDWLEQACKNIGRHNWEELRQEFWLKILSTDDRYFERIRDIRFYCIRVLYSVKADIHRAESKTVPEPVSSDYNHDIDRAIMLKESILGKLPMYERVLYRFNEQGMSLRKIAKETRIDRNEISQTINRVKEIIADIPKHI